jgi:hypothetical protein
MRTGWLLEMSPSDHYWRRYEVGQWLVFGWFWGWGTSDMQFSPVRIDSIYGPVFRPHACQLHAILDGVWVVWPSTSGCLVSFCVRSLKCVRSVEKMTPTARKKGFLHAVGWEDILRWNSTWHKPPRKVSYKRTFGAPDQGQMLDMWESQTSESALRWRTHHIAPHHILELTLEVILEVVLKHVLGIKTMTSLILDHMATAHLYLGINTGEKVMILFLVIVLELSQDWSWLNKHAPLSSSFVDPF